MIIEICLLNEAKGQLWRIDIHFIDYRSTAYYVIPLITLFFRDKMENVITRFHCILNMVKSANVRKWKRIVRHTPSCLPSIKIGGLRNNVNTSFDLVTYIGFGGRYTELDESDLGLLYFVWSALSPSFLVEHQTINEFCVLDGPTAKVKTFSIR